MEKHNPTSIREINTVINSRNKDLRNLLIVDYSGSLGTGKNQHYRLRLIRSARIKKILKNI